MIFGEIVDGYSVPVLNEREVRAGAGILFFISIVVFLGAWYADRMLPAQLMIIAFGLDFLIRLMNPRYAPSLILGRLAVAQQQPEYTAAAPKRFAWGIGFALALFMVITLIFMQQMSILNFAICAICIVLLFLESSFGICLGCLVYHHLFRQPLTLCPGGVCEVRSKAAIQQVHFSQWGMLILFSLLLYAALHLLANRSHLNHNPIHHPVIQQLKEGVTPPPPPTEMNHPHQHH